MQDTYELARDFVRREGRVLEQRAFLSLFEGEPIDGVVRALAAYQNGDGGFGHGLEPDVRCPASVPLAVDFALHDLAAVGARWKSLDATGRVLLTRACDFLAAWAGRDGSGPAVALTAPVIEQYPHAPHWAEWAYAPALNPTAGIVGHLYALGVEHPWRDAAATWCWEQVEAMVRPDNSHTLLAVLTFLAHVPDRARADAAADAVSSDMASVPGMHLDPASEGYGLTPLQFAATADAPWRRLFTDAQIERDLDFLAEQQQPDGGWPVEWEPPTPSSRVAWRGHVTVQALRTLVSYGRVGQLSVVT